MRIANQAAYAALLEPEVKPMAAWFNDAGCRTVNSMPAATYDWPEGEFYRFQRKYYFRDFGCRGPSLKWARMTDQFAVRVIHEREVAPAREPLFVQYELISGHYPFSLIPRLFEDRSGLGDGSVYSKEGAVRALSIPAGAATAGAAGYGAAMEYQLSAAVDYGEVLQFGQASRVPRVFRIHSEGRSEWIEWTCRSARRQSSPLMIPSRPEACRLPVSRR